MVDGFLGRWSQRKTAARQVAESPQPPPQGGQAGAADNPQRSLQQAHESLPGGAAGTVAPPPLQAGASPTGLEPAVPLPTLQDVAELTADSDFSPFVARAVAPQVRNAAMKKLFSDPHFNVMDGLDTYIDDYSIADPLPLEMLRKMASAKFMQLVDDPDSPESGGSLDTPDTPDTPHDAACAVGYDRPVPIVSAPSAESAVPSPPATPPDTDPQAPCA